MGNTFKQERRRQEQILARQDAQFEELRRLEALVSGGDPAGAIRPARSPRWRR